ncbi:hypothetical protein A9995_05880 [Erythrobacter sp. QSSC1-22B]|uniref:phosphatase domain-containing protein n=1 Tax=Erythrobacter sp. QSSC1-22B TaxID=1860125 RepID=UPI00080594C3|nr:phosphatase domain-containing protein [Erythrobacter sp. QSSC1-22B]OBX20061.1 hypothetical protein A9995_05880 [Erythrobacter sp. QSSC1-22B]
MALFPTKPVRIQPYFGYRNRHRLMISARALRAPRPGFERSGRLRAVRTMLAQFASHEVADLPVELELQHRDGRRFQHRGVTDHEGFVHFDVPLEPAWELNANSQWEVVTFRWNNGEGRQSVEGHILAPGSHASLGVISDIDDTIIETGITGSWRKIARNWRRVVMELPDDRLLVPGADVFYNALGGGAVLDAGETHTGDRLAATHHPFFYVSSSPWNLFSYLVAFQKSRGLPLGPLMLRDWGLNRETFGSGSHGAHKIAAIAGIIETYESMQFALIGDDSQGDLTAFADVVASHPGRVRAVFIRRAGDPLSPEELAARAVIEAASVPLWLGDCFTAGQQFLDAIGLSHDGEAERIVEVVEKPNHGAPAAQRQAEA